jgi:hypothetical protein
VASPQGSRGDVFAAEASVQTPLLANVGEEVIMREVLSPSAEGVIALVMMNWPVIDRTILYLAMKLNRGAGQNSGHHFQTLHHSPHRQFIPKEEILAEHHASRGEKANARARALLFITIHH